MSEFKLEASSRSAPRTSAPVPAAATRTKLEATPQPAALVLDRYEWPEAARQHARLMQWAIQDEIEAEREHRVYSSLSPAQRQVLAAELACIVSAPNGSRLLGASRSDASTAGAKPSITAPASSHEAKYTGGFDTLEISAYCTFNPKSWRALRDRLEWAKAERQADRAGYLEHPEDGQAIPVNPSGIVKGPIRCPWVIEIFPGVTIAFADEASHGESGRPNVFVRVGAIAFLCARGFYWWREVQNVIAHFGATVDKHVISRIDACIDLVNVPLAEFVVPFTSGKYVTNARKWAHYGEGSESTGISIGRGTVLRIYDKLREVRGDSEKFQLMLSQRWGGVLPQSSTRVEFQLRNEELRKNYGISTVEDMEKLAGSLFVKLCEEWFRLTAKVPDRKGKHQSRAGIAESWKTTKEAFAQVFEYLGEVLEKPVKVVPDVNRLRDQMAGCLSSAFAAIFKTEQLINESLGSLEDFIGAATALLAGSFGTIFERTLEKSVEFRTKRVSSAIGDQFIPKPGGPVYG